jgi:hypothetical protein
MTSLDDIAMHIEIRQALARYSQGVDHGDLELAKSAYWPEGTDHHGGTWNGNGHEYVTQLIERDEQRRENGFPAPGGMHHLTTILVRRDDDTHATVQTYFVVYQPHDTDGTYHLGLVVGRYLDRFERRGEEWRILARDVVNDFTRMDIPGPIWPRASWQEGEFLPGAFGSADPGVQRLSPFLL